MGDEDQQSSQSPESSTPEPTQPGPPTGRPGWADSLSKGSPDSRSRVDVDLAKRLREEDVARIARQRAAAEAARKAAEEAARRASGSASPSPGVPPTDAGTVSKWPSILAAAVVIGLGAFIGQRIVGSEGAPQAAPTAFPIVSAEPTPPSRPTAKPAPTNAAPSGRLDTYTVKLGDTLESIAQQFKRTPAEVSQANGAYGGLIRVQTGQVINIP